MYIGALAIKSFRNRKLSVGLAITSITLSVALLLSVEILRNQAKSSFANTVSSTDLIVGARSSSVNLLLYSVFRLGNPTNNIEWSSYDEIRRIPGVKWSIPLSMGDTHRGFRVVGTDDNYFKHYRYARDRRLTLRDGLWFSQNDEAVLGAEVAARLSYRPGDNIVVAHGAGDESFITHDDKPFRVVGVLEHTGTPVDRALHVSLGGFDRMHADWQGAADKHGHDPLAGVPSDTSAGEENHAGEDESHDNDTERASDRAISAFLLGLDSRAMAIGLQRRINQFDREPLSAVLPGVALLELWEIVGLVENTLLAISLFVVIVGLFSMLIILMASINERRREMAILRAMGARPGYIFALILGEAIFITLVGLGLGILLTYGMFLLGQDWMAYAFGLFIGFNPYVPNLFYIVLLVALFGCLIGLIPGIRMYRYSLIDGMSVRI